MERDRAASLAHHLTVIGLLASVCGHAFSPARNAPGFIGAAAFACAAIGMLGGALALVTGSVLSLARRLRGRSARLKRSAADIIPLASQILLGASGALYFFSAVSDSAALLGASRLLHDVSAALFLVSFSATKLYHVLGFIRLKKAGIPRLTGVLPRDAGVEALRAQEDLGRVGIGLSSLADLTSLQRIEASACVSCGLCDEACPATMMGRELSPKRLTRAQADLMRAVGDAGDMKLPPSLSAATDACTSCYACETACPFSIRKVDRVVGIRRYAILEKGEAALAHRRALRNLEQTGNTSGIDAGARRQLLSAAGIPIFDGGRPDYVLWLGCQAGYDPRARSTVLAVAERFKASGKTIAALENESCCGDFPRRIGEENLFLDIVHANTAVFSRLNGVPILTVCPHCAVSLGREYPELGVPLSVVHYSEALNELAVEEAAAPAATRSRPLRAAYHDSCLIARVLGRVEEPRRFLERARPDVELVPLGEEGIDTLCCGGGGGRIVAEEKPEERVALRVIDECVRKEVDVLLVSCPSCLAMYSDAAAFRQSGTRVMDLLELAAPARALQGKEKAGVA